MKNKIFFNTTKNLFLKVKISLSFFKLFLFCFFLSSYSILLAQDNAYQQFEGTKISIILPEGFTKVDGQSAFVHNGSASSFQAQEVPGIASVYSMKAFTKENIEQNNTDITFISEEDLITDSGAEAKLVTVGFNTQGMDFERIMFITGDYNYSVIINCNYPKMTKKLLYEKVKKSLLSVRF